MPSTVPWRDQNPRCGASSHRPDSGSILQDLKHTIGAHSQPAGYLRVCASDPHRGCSNGASHLASFTSEMRFRDSATLLVPVSKILNAIFQPRMPYSCEARRHSSRWPLSDRFPESRRDCSLGVVRSQCFSNLIISSPV